MNAQNPREIAARILLARGGDAGHVEQNLETALARQPLAAADQRLTMELVYGVVRWQATLDHLIDRQAARSRPDWRLRNLLRLGLYQLFWLSRIPDHAAVHQTVALARPLGCASGAGFLNAILRAYTRQKEETRRLLRELTETQPALGWSHPQWLVDRWTAQWGAESTRRLLEWNNAPPPLYARVNALRFSSDELLARWRQEQIEAQPLAADWLPERLVYLLPKHPALASLGSFQSGGFYVQDPSTLMAVSLLDPQPGEHILDACAAPGGKTSYSAQLMHNRGRVVAWDTMPERLARLRDNVSRLGIANVEIALAGWDAAPEPRFDRVLLDVPCSNTGVMRRRVELRWRLEPAEIARLAATQYHLLTRAALLVKSGGVLVYSTCSLEPEENQQITARFLAEHPAWQCREERALRPFADGVDGAYAAALIQKTTA